MLLLYKNFRRNSLRYAAPPTPEQPDFAESKSQILRPGGTQNLSVLLPLKSACSARKHPLSSVSGRRRYNTLDFPQENRVPTGRFHPYWKPRIQGICYPFEIPARLCMCSYKLKNSFSIHIHKRKKSQRVPLARKGILWDFHYAAFMRRKKFMRQLLLRQAVS